MTRLYIFADDSMLGREATALGNVKGTDYIAAEMKRLGLTPGGENGTYFQTVPVVVVRIDSTKTISIDGARLALGTDVLPFSANSAAQVMPRGATTRSVDGTQAVFGGQLGSGPLISPSDAAGKLVVFALPVDSTGRRDIRPMLRTPLTAYADAAGIAIAALDVVPPNVAARYRAPSTRVKRDDALAAPAAPTIMLVSGDAASRMLGATIDAATPGAQGKRISGTVAFTETPSPYPARNVIGILQGSDPALRGQYVAVGAHNDHVGLTNRPLDHDSVEANNRIVRPQGVQDPVRLPTPQEQQLIAHLRDSLTKVHGGPRPDSVNNGADDDGSGTVTMLEIAERFATQPHPKRSLIFVSHTGEEKGLWGSEWFTDHPTIPRDSIVAQLNMDMVGRGKPTDVMGRGPNNIQMIGSRRLSTQLGDLIDSLNTSRTPHMDPDYSFDAAGHPLNRYCRSDHYMYARFGIPITYFSLGYHTGYHQVVDEPQYIDYDHMARIAGFVHDIAEAVANRPQRLVVDKPKPDPRGGCRQ
jgi:hypothetical protein